MLRLDKVSNWYCLPLEVSVLLLKGGKSSKENNAGGPLGFPKSYSRRLVPLNWGTVCEKFEIDEDTDIPKGVAPDGLVIVSPIKVTGGKGGAELLAGSARA